MTPLIKHVLVTTAVLAVGSAAAFGIFIHSGAYDFAADVPHTPLVFSLLDRMRERSVEAHASGIKVPDLSDRQRIVQGAGNYNAMCVQCHRAPGVGETELSKGLYPSPPNLAQEPVEAAHAFWVIKHGVKASGMPAWGKSMNDEYIWNMVAFLKAMPTLDETGYRSMVAQSGGHAHGGGETHGQEEDPAHGHEDGHHHDEADHPDGDHHDHTKAAGGHTHAKGKAHPPSALPDAKPKESKS